MDCSDVQAVLDLEDAARRCPVGDLERHLRSCLECRERHGDVAALLTALETPAAVPALPELRLPRRRAWVPWTAAAAVLVIAARIVLTGAPREPLPEPLPEPPPAAPGPALAQESTGSFTRSIVTLRGGRPVRTTFSRSVWRPPAAKCLAGQARAGERGTDRQEKEGER